MQIHVTSPDPAECARILWRNPVRARKMITETQQILACCQYEYGFFRIIYKTDGSPYKTPLSIRNHPVTKWCKSNKINISWTIRYLKCLYGFYEGDGFHNVPRNIHILESQFIVMETIPLSFLNFAKSDAKGLDFTDCGVHFAYRRFLEAQEK